ncbi:unnamed protein product [Nippostrongylus brasiliensis]|uniref:Aldo-keto reductase family 1 member C-like protein 1 (inferred by orthology to a human protein) n=1 Tax=Nippostrongylus brasiliensis TaxID=27835 RepID=A0A0N4XFC0_NIPBR|nr:unnamed protein product [Nippostrongylus brasiliensis]
MPLPTVKLSSGFEMPVLGLGTWQSKPGEVGKAIEIALNAGYSHIDCAYAYGNQEEIVSLFDFSEKMYVFITSKVWNTFHSTPSCKHVTDILKQLKLDYIDLMLIHWPTGYEEGGELFPKRPNSDRMKYSDGKVGSSVIRSIGIANFNHKQIERLIANSTIKPAVLQVEIHPYLQQKKLRAFCKQHDIAVTAYGSLANPGSAYYRKPGDPDVLTDTTIKNIASAHKKTPAQIALRWAVQQNILVIPKSTSEVRIKENAALFDFELTEEEMKQIETLDRGWRLVNPTARDGDHPLFPFPHPIFDKFCVPT